MLNKKQSKPTTVEKENRQKTFKLKLRHCDYCNLNTHTHNGNKVKMEEFNEVVCVREREREREREMEKLCHNSKVQQPSHVSLSLSLSLSLHLNTKKHSQATGARIMETKRNCANTTTTRRVQGGRE